MLIKIKRKRQYVLPVDIDKYDETLINSKFIEFIHINSIDNNIYYLKIGMRSSHCFYNVECTKEEYYDMINIINNYSK